MKKLIAILAPVVGLVASSLAFVMSTNGPYSSVDLTPLYVGWVLWSLVLWGILYIFVNRWPETARRWLTVKPRNTAVWIVKSLGRLAVSYVVLLLLAVFLGGIVNVLLTNKTLSPPADSEVFGAKNNSCHSPHLSARLPLTQEPIGYVQLSAGIPFKIRAENPIDPVCGASTFLNMDEKWQFYANWFVWSLPFAIPLVLIKKKYAHTRH